MTKTRKLHLDRQAICVLAPRQLQHAAGGAASDPMQSLWCDATKGVKMPPLDPVDGD